jgi:outer membrane receptor for ferrienterochelin and colicins
MKFAVLFVSLVVFCVCPVFAQDDELPVYEAEGITITGTRTEKRLKDSPVATEVITEKEIENSGAATVMDILDSYGIMVAHTPMGDSVQLQGMGKGRVLYLIDGRRIAGRAAQRLSGETLPLGNVERIEIVKGPQSALYGSDGIGGVINIITKKPQGDVSASVALTNRFLLDHYDSDTPEDMKPSSEFNPVREQTAVVKAGFPIAGSRNSLTLEGARGDYYYAKQESYSILPEYYRGRAGFDTAISPGDISELRFGGSLMLMRSDEKNETPDRKSTRLNSSHCT